MTTIWELVKRHKGKLVIGGAVVGGYLAVNSHLKQRQQKQQENSLFHDDIQMQARRHYVFDANQRACDDSIKELAPSIALVVKNRLNVDPLTKELHDGEVTSERKLELWNDIKVLVFSAIVSHSFAFSLLTVALKAQISILAAEICAQSTSATMTNGWLSYLSPALFSWWTSSKDTTAEQSSATSRQVFIRSIQYFTTTGVEDLVDEVTAVVRKELDEQKLDSVMDGASLRDLLSRIADSISKSSNNFFVKFIAPMEELTSSGWSDDGVTRLLERLVCLLQSEKTKMTTMRLVDYYCTNALHGIESAPLAKLLGRLSTSTVRLSRTDLESPLENSLCSSDVHQFAVHSFNLKHE